MVESIKILDEQKVKPWSTQGQLFLAELYTGTGQIEKAITTLQKAEGMFKDMGMDYYLRVVQLGLQMLQG